MGAVSSHENLALVGLEFVFSSLGCLICEYRRDCTAPNKVSCRQSKNYDLQSVCSTCSTCKNLQYMYRTFSVAVSVAVMLLKKGSVERFCKTKIRTKFRHSPCESVYEFLHELCVLHIFIVCAGQVHVRHDPISRNFLRQFISRSLQVSLPQLRKFVRSFALHDVERKFVRIFVLQNLSSDSFVSYETSQ